MPATLTAKIQEQVEAMRQYVKARGIYKLGGPDDSSSDDEAEFEKSFSQLAHTYLQQKAPGLLDYEIGFQLVDKAEDDSKALGVTGFKVGPMQLIAPVIFLNGDLKGQELLWIKDQDLYVPLMEEWLNYLLNRKPHKIGGGVTRNLRELGVLPGSVFQFKYPPTKYANDAVIDEALGEDKPQVEKDKKKTDDFLRVQIKEGEGHNEHYGQEKRYCKGCETHVTPNKDGKCSRCDGELSHQHEQHSLSQTEWQQFGVAPSGVKSGNAEWDGILDMFRDLATSVGAEFGDNLSTRVDKKAALPGEAHPVIRSSPASLGSMGAGSQHVGNMPFEGYHPGLNHHSGMTPALQLDDIGRNHPASALAGIGSAHPQPLSSNQPALSHDPADTANLAATGAAEENIHGGQHAGHDGLMASVKTEGLGGDEHLMTALKILGGLGAAGAGAYGLHKLLAKKKTHEEDADKEARLGKDAPNLPEWTYDFLQSFARACVMPWEKQASLPGSAEGLTDLAKFLKEGGLPMICSFKSLVNDYPQLMDGIDKFYGRDKIAAIINQVEEAIDNANEGRRSLGLHDKPPSLVTNPILGGNTQVHGASGDNTYPGQDEKHGSVAGTTPGNGPNSSPDGSDWSWATSDGLDANLTSKTAADWPGLAPNQIARFQGAGVTPEMWAAYSQHGGRGNIHNWYGNWQRTGNTAMGAQQLPMPSVASQAGMARGPEKTTIQAPDGAAFGPNLGMHNVRAEVGQLGTNKDVIPPAGMGAAGAAKPMPQKPPVISTTPTGMKMGQLINPFSVVSKAIEPKQTPVPVAAPPVPAASSGPGPITNMMQGMIQHANMSTRGVAKPTVGQNTDLGAAKSMGLAPGLEGATNPAGVAKPQPTPAWRPIAPAPKQQGFGPIPLPKQGDHMPAQMPSAPLVGAGKGPQMPSVSAGGPSLATAGASPSNAGVQPPTPITPMPGPLGMPALNKGAVSTRVDKTAGMVRIIHFRSAGLSPLFGEDKQLEAGEKEKLMKGEVVIRDTRPNTAITRAYEVLDYNSFKFFNPTETGLYDVLVQPGEFTKCAVFDAPWHGHGISKGKLVIRLDNKTWLHTHGQRILCKYQHPYEEYLKWFQGLEEANEVDEDDLYCLVSPSGNEATVPCTARLHSRNGDFRVYKTNFLATPEEEHVGSERCPIQKPDERLLFHRWHYSGGHDGQDMGHEHTGMYPVGKDKLVFTGKPGKRFRLVDGELLIPKGTRYIDLSENPACGCGHDSEPAPILHLATLHDLQMRIHEHAGQPLEIAKSGSEFQFDGNKRYEREDAVVYLVRDRGLREKAARVLLDSVTAGKVKTVFLKEALGPEYAHLNHYVQGAPGHPEPSLYEQPTLDNTVPAHSPEPWLQAVPGMGAELTDYNVYDPRWIRFPYPSLGDVSHETQQAESASEKGQKEIFDTSMISAIVKNLRPESAISQHLGPIMQTMSRYGKLLLNLYWNSEEWEDRYGKDELPAIEDLLKDTFENTGKLILGLKEEDESPRFSQSVLPDIRRNQESISSDVD